MSKTVKTKKGTELPLINLKGKDYLQVAYRIQWFTEEESHFTIDTEFLTLTDEQTVARATIQVFSKDGKLVRKATGTKRESKKDFSDHTEKAETGAIGRALIELGYGTQFALADLDEGDRIVDSPVTDVKKMELKVTSGSDGKSVTEVVSETTTKKSSFRKPKAQPEPQVAVSGGDGWE